jgi:hypothetical protein
MFPVREARKRTVRLWVKSPQCLSVEGRNMMPIYRILRQKSQDSPLAAVMKQGCAFTLAMLYAVAPAAPTQN